VKESLYMNEPIQLNTVTQPPGWSGGTVFFSSRSLAWNQPMAELPANGDGRLLAFRIINLKIKD
jgi:hypothetical protein